MKTILCFGDSNTYGYDPRDFWGGRYDARDRWTGILDADPDLRILNFGQNGRMIPANRIAISAAAEQIAERTFDRMTLMLGTNDLLFSSTYTMEMITDRMDRFLGSLTGLAGLRQEPEKILLLAPPHVVIRDEGYEECCERSEQFGAYYRTLARKYHTAFADANSWNIRLAADGVHFTPEGHHTFARRIREILAAEARPE